VIRLAVLVLAGLGALASAAAAEDPQQLRGGIGPGASLSLLDASGAKVKELTAGTYDVHVTDGAWNHNFHLQGPNVDRFTPVLGNDGDYDWRLTLEPGTYIFFCDPHYYEMQGTFVVRAPVTTTTTTVLTTTTATVSKPPAKKPPKAKHAAKKKKKKKPVR
jgi:hypothetical protein